MAMPTAAQAQSAIVSGIITDSAGTPISGARIHIVGTNTGITANDRGSYKLEVPSGRSILLQFSYLSFAQQREEIPALAPGQEYLLNIKLPTIYELSTVTVTGDKKDKRMQMQRVDPKAFESVPNPSGGIEGLLKMLAPVASNNELSSQYSVRGGNYDENLVYLNDIEVYRPMLIRSGQQEGLSILHPDMVKNLSFSAGGFEARYGDKLSSVLDIEYKEPDSFASKISASLLGASASLEGSSDNHRFTYLFGGRYKTNQYLLNSLDVKGEYKPSFNDVQAYLTYDVTDKIEIGLLSYYGHNRYLSVPQTQETTFGTVTTAVRLKVFFDGQEIFQYNTWLNGLTASWKPTPNTRFKWINSVTVIDEQENFDVIGQYRLQELDNDLGSDDFGEATYTFGIGGYLDHARNRLTSQIYNTEWKAEHDIGKRNLVSWGLKYQHEEIDDKLSEYRYIDSADYSVPQDTDNVLNVYEYIYSINNQGWNRYMGYLQDRIILSEEYNAMLNVGVRGNFWDFNKEMLISPRLQFSIEPTMRYNRRLLREGNDSMLRNPIRFRAAVGSYNQPPFYRELRGLTGVLNPEIRAQKSYHFLVGGEYEFQIWKRPFKWSVETYYKKLEDIIPYEIDNVRIRYYATNNARGYAAGMDMQLNGEFVEDNPSWVSLAVLSTKENILNDSATVVVNEETGETKTIYPGYVPRPTDQHFRFSVFFQDDLPNRPKDKVHLSYIYGSSLPFGPPDYKRYKDTLRLPDYMRVDIGFSRLLYKKGMSETKSRVLKSMNSIWLSAEVFNLFGINNTVSQLWVKDISGNDWAVPRYLTGRRLNIHLQIKF